MKRQVTSIELNGRAYLITGKPGIGKSSLALSLIQKGATLISDDLTDIQKGVAYAPKIRRGCLEVRGFGPVTGFPVCEKAPIAAEIQITQDKPERFPLPSDKSPPVFQIWSQDSRAADKVWIIDQIINGKLKVE